MKIGITYSTADDPTTGGVYVLEAVEGAQGGTRFGPMPRKVVENFIRARRERFDLEMRKRGAVKILLPQRH